MCECADFWGVARKWEKWIDLFWSIFFYIVAGGFKSTLFEMTVIIYRTGED